MSTDVILRPFHEGDVAWLTERHQTLYGSSEGFDNTFGPLVQSILEGFVQSHDAKAEAGWIAQSQGERLGSIFCVRYDETTAKLP